MLRVSKWDESAPTRGMPIREIPSRPFASPKVASGAWPGFDGGMAFPADHPFLTPLAFGLGTALLDGLLSRVWRGLPLYRRHLGLFGLGLAVVIAFRAGGTGWIDAAAVLAGLSIPSLRWLRGRRLSGLSWVKGSVRRPDPTRPLILVADPHWGDTLTGLREATAAHPEADWLFLGDLFEVWVGLPGLEEPNQDAFLAWVAERRAAGRWVGLWTGNREFFLDGLSSRFDLIGEGVGGALPEEGLVWEHGDLLDGRLWAYRLMFLLFRSGPMWLFARFAPTPHSRAVAGALRRKFAARPGTYQHPVPLPALEAAGKRSGAACFVVGHFHHAAQAGCARALPWAHEGQFQVWKDGRILPLGSTL